MWLRAVIFGIPMLGLIVWAHLYLYKHLVKPLQSKHLRRVIAGAAIALFLTGFSLRFITPIFGPVPATVIMIWAGFLLYTLLMMLLAKGATRFKPERRELFQRGALVVAGGISGYGTYRAFNEPEVTETVVKLPNLPSALEGMKIVQLTDIHVGPLIQQAFLSDLVNRANSLKPDLAVITGDLVDGKVNALGKHVQELGRLQGRLGRFFITGNHDYYSGADEWCEFVQKLGIDVLRNRSLLVQPGLRLVGVDDWSAHRFGDGGYDLEQALSEAHPQDEATILLAHQPAGFDEAVEKGVRLQLSGHTHGGQLFPATLGAMAIWPGRSRGLATLGDASLYVSRGCGFVGPPMRVGSPPEIATIILTRA